jgi:hypothetical protein
VREPELAAAFLNVGSAEVPGAGVALADGAPTLCDETPEPAAPTLWEEALPDGCGVGS